MTSDDSILVIYSAQGARAVVDPERYERDRQVLVTNGMPTLRTAK